MISKKGTFLSLSKARDVHAGRLLAFIGLFCGAALIWVPQASAQEDGMTPEVVSEETTGASEAAPSDSILGDAIDPAETPHSGTYYDTEAIGRDPALAGAAPRKVDPKFEPAQKYMVVEPGAPAQSRDAMIVAANRALKLGRYASAMQMFENLYKKNRRDPRVLMGLAVSQQESGFSESAVQTYEELLALQPNNVDAKVNMLGLMRNKYPSVAIRQLMDLWEQQPRNAGVAAQIGLLNAEQGQYEEAFRYLGIAVSLEPDNAEHAFNMAVVADRLGSKKEAISYYEKALEVAASAGGESASRQVIYDRLAVLRRQ